MLPFKKYVDALPSPIVRHLRKFHRLYSSVTSSTAATGGSPIVRGLRKFYHTIRDATDRWQTPPSDTLPPRSLRYYVGTGDFGTIGEEFAGYFRDLGGLQPDHRVLDIGCGSGRMAIPLLRYLTPPGCYTGFDISRRAIEWCAEHITARNADFRFVWVDVFNSEYNPAGKQTAAEYRFPCDDGSADFVFATSVFTHMQANEVRHYLAEVRRVLASSGRGLFTHFVLDAKAEELMGQSRASLRFHVPLDDCWSVDPEVPERAIAYSEPTLRRMYGEAGLVIEEPLRFGAWAGRPDGLSYQDIVVVTKR
jgi:SAM-dependent methyltransferase